MLPYRGTNGGSPGFHVIRFVGLKRAGEAILMSVDRDGDAELCVERNTRMAISLRFAAINLRIGRSVPCVSA